MNGLQVRRGGHSYIRTSAGFGCAALQGMNGSQVRRGVVGCKIPRKENSPIFQFFARPPVPVSPGLPEDDPTIDENKRPGLKKLG